ncbi:MAG: O-antigen ligase family protein, partial [Phycisphaerae bacterium]
MSERRCGAVVACQLPARSIASWLEQAAMFVLLGVVAFRALLQEVYEEPPGLDWLGGVLAAGPGPATTILIGGAIQLAVLLWLVAAAVRGRLAYRPAGLEIGWVLLLIASAISAGFAGNKRLAVVASTDVLVQILLAAVLVQLLGEPRRQRLALAVVIASGTVFAVKCISQWAFEFEQTRCYWQQYVRPALSGYASQFDRAYLRLFEKRMEAAEASGYFFHSNVAGRGRAVVRAAWRPTRLWAVRLVGGLVGPGLCLAGLVLTRSRGAMVTGLVAAWLGALVLSGRLWVRRRRVAAAAIVVGPLVVGVMVLSLVVGARAGGRVGPGQAVGQVAGVFRGSVVFRMQYWRGASAMIADHWLTGVGPGNFGRHYLQYKPPGASEEVQNPHNLFFAVLAEWGWLGGAAVAAMIAGAGWV